MEIQPLSFAHQPLIKKKFTELALQLSEYSFANLFLFRQLHQYAILTIQQEVFIKGITRDGVSFIMLTNHPKAISWQVLKEASEQAEMLFPIPDSWLPSLEPHLAQMSFKEDDSDYLFTPSKLATFPGRHLSKKRNLVKQLFESYKIDKRDISPSCIPDVELVLESWQKEHLIDPNDTDYSACKEAIRYFQELNLHGRLVYVDDVPSGFVIGEWITAGNYVVHFDKAKKSVKGLYQHLFQDLAQTLDGSAAWINIEQDLGLSPLRQTKQSYLPDVLLRKWRIALNP